MSDGRRRLAEEVLASVRRLVREALSLKPGAHLVEATLDHIELHLAFGMRDAGPEASRRAMDLASQLDRLLDQAIQEAVAFRPGHAFCHRCAVASCEHSEPPSSRHVFVGYAPTGTPMWAPLAQYCLELRHPEVQGLYEDPPAFLTLFLDAESLRGRLLDAYQAGEHELLGQVAAGLFSVPSRVGEGRGVLALTFQVMASRPRSGPRRFGLNILGRTPGGHELEALWERQDDLPWRRAVVWAQAALRSLSSPGARRAGGGMKPAALERRVAGILNGLARRLEQDQRARLRRTGHAERRHGTGERPTRSAMEDTRAAPREAVLFDERHGTLVVLGERGRTHFFTAEGRLVSSVRYSRDALARKRQLGIWREASEEEARALRARVDTGPSDDQVRTADATRRP